MKELEDSQCEVRKTLDLQFSITDRLNASFEEENGSLGSSGSNRRTKSLGNVFADATYAWVSCGPRLVVINVKNGVSIGSWTFRERVSCVAPFPAQSGQIPLLLVGLDNGASRVRDSYGLVCVFDCTTSRVLRAIRTPAGVEQICVISGGAEWEDCGDKETENVLAGSNGTACVALRNLNHLIIDLRRSTWDSAQVTPLVDESNPAELDFTERRETLSTRHKYNREKHAALNLMNSRLEQYIGFSREEFESSTMYEESLTSSLICSRKIGCLVSGCLGRIIIWQTDGDIKWISGNGLDESLSVTHLALLEPTDDPRPFCYLWSAHQEESNGGAPILRMYAMLFERKYTEKGTNSYFNLEGDPSVKFELELDETERITSLCPVVRESNSDQTESTYKRGEESILLISLESRAIVFDLNQWYQEQMPHTIGECTNPNAIIANYRTRSDLDAPIDETVLSCAYAPETLKEFPCKGSAPSEQLFFPNALSLEWIELSTTRLTFWITRGLQAELLRAISMAGPVVLIEPTETFNRCVAAGLVSSNPTEFPSNRDSKDSQRETLLSLCLEQRWSQFLLKCAREWSDGSASYLFPTFLRWAMQRASTIKLAVDRLSEPLYDQSGTSIGEAEVKQLRFYSQQLECVTSVLTNLEVDGVDLTKERRTLRRVSTYTQVLLWFYDVGLLPESQEIEDELPISFSLRIPYPYDKLASIYREKRQEFARNSTKNPAEQEEDMFIDELVTRECSTLKSQWEREGGESSLNGYYPPSSLQSLLRSFLTDCQNNSDASEMDNKHQITIYLLMDLAMLLQNTCPGVNQLIKYPSAFKLSPSFIKLTQAFWLLDHEDYHGFLDMMTGQLVSDSDVKDWHHKLVMRTLIRNNQNKLALIYLRVRKPPLTSIDDQSTAISLSVGHGLVQSAFHRRPPTHYAQLLTSFYRACKKYDRLHDILHLVLDPEEEQVFVKFLENEKSEDTRLLYYLQRCRYAEASNIYPVASATSARTNYQRNNDRSVPLTIFNAYNATLPDITRKLSASGSPKNSNVESPSRFLRPMSHCKSRLTSRDMHEIVMRKARETFLHRDRTRIPFVSAPCVHFASQATNLENNSVLFVDRVKKSRGKRSLDDMRGDASSPSLDQNDPRKRRKFHDSSIANIREIGSSMVFDTPLVKRKNQSVSTRNTPIETPHSILKIRQLIRDSTSPCPTDGSSKNLVDLKIHERERKRRQIRFSLGQQRASLDDDVPNSQENHPDPAKNESTDEEQEQEENCYSLNASAKSIYEPTLLDPSSDLSVNDSINVSGPRPRPSLRKTNESTSSELLKRTLKKLSKDANESPGEMSFSLREHETCSRIVQTHDVFSETMYTESILSSDTSFERTLPPKWPFPEVSSSSDDNACEETSTSPKKTHHFHSFSQTVTKTSISQKSHVFQELDNDFDDDKNSEVLMEVDGFGLDRESTNQSPVKKSIGDFRNTKMPENAMETTSSLGQENSEQEIDHENETDAIQDEEMEQSDSIASESLRGQQSPRNFEGEDVAEKDRENEIYEDLENPERDISKSGDDYDDELLALRYEEDNDDEDDEENDEVFQSLSNSLDVASARSKLSLERSVGTSDRDDQLVEKLSTIPSNNNGFYEMQKISSDETNITDDESSCSADESAAIANLANANTDLDKTVSVEILETAFVNEASNITNDESSSSFDSAMFTVQKPSQILTKNRASYEAENKIDDDTSGDSAIFSSQKLGVSTEKVLDGLKESENPSEKETQVKRGKESSVETEVLTPLRMTRARRASMVAAQEQSPKIESPITRSSSAGRLRRASSLAKDLFSSTVENPASPAKPKSTRLRRSISLAKELAPVQTIEEIPSQEESPIGRRTRRAVSVQKEVPAKSKIKKSTSKLSLSEETVLEEPTIGRKTTRAKKTASTSKDEETSAAAPKRLTRASSLAKETEDKDDEHSATLPKRNTRKRGTSVPKDETLETSVKLSQTRSRRGGSVAKELAAEEPVEQEEKSRKRRATSRSKDATNLEKATSWSATTSTLQRRLSSITAIPEEEDKIKEGEESDEEIFTSRPKSTESTKNTRLRRAASIDSSLIGVKRRTRTTSIQSSIIDEPIEEEETQDYSESKTKLAKKAPVRRKRTTSVTTSRDNIHENEPEKLPPRRTRKLSQKSNDGDTFRFSPPGKVLQRPGDDDEKGDTEVPDYVFSPPHTRSKCITPPP